MVIMNNRYYSTPQYTLDTKVINLAYPLHNLTNTEASGSAGLLNTFYG